MSPTVVAFQEESGGSDQQQSPSSSLGQLIRHQSFARIERLCRESPEQVSEISEYNLFSSKAKSYPLHYLCRRPRVPLSTLQAVVQAAPEALAYTDSVSHSTPLHVACWYKLPLSAIHVLLKADPSALHVPDVDGNLPLHTAAAWQTPDVVLALLEACDDYDNDVNNIVGQLNHKRQTPLHMACQRPDIAPRVLQALLQRHPGAAAHRDFLRRCPLHHACMHQADEAVLRVLVEEGSPQAALVWDNFAMTPYGICRKRWQWPVRDGRVQLLRRAMQRAESRAAIVCRNRIQFVLEDLANGVSGRHSNSHNKALGRLTKLPV